MFPYFRINIQCIDMDYFPKFEVLMSRDFWGSLEEEGEHLSFLWKYVNFLNALKKS